MASTDVRKDILGIINEVERKLAIKQSTTLTDRALTEVLLDFTNDVIDEVSDYGDWPQMFREIDVTAATSGKSYEIAVSSNVKNVHEIHFQGQVAPLKQRSISEIRVLQKTSGSGEPRQFCIVDTSATNPKFRVYPIPGSNQNDKVFDVAYYKKPRLYTTASADSSAVPAFPSRVLVQGVYAKALLEENGQEATKQFEMAYQEYVRMRREALNRLTVDTGGDFNVVPV
jgi:hypothetical protein